jgi:hypothetical protein
VTLADVRAAGRKNCGKKIPEPMGLPRQASLPLRDERWAVVEHEIPPGSNSGILIISTDATSFTSGIASVHNGTGADVASFEPVAPATTPEPTSILLFKTGLLGLARAMRRKVA